MNGKRLVIFVLVSLVIGTFYYFQTQKVSSGVYEAYHGEIDLLERKIELGKHLFFDPRLSLDNSISCASCHHPNLAFTDGKSRSEGVKGHLSKRNAPSLLNVSKQTYFMMDGGVLSLSAQVSVPIHDSNEMGTNYKLILQKLKSDQFYKDESFAVFNRKIDPFVISQSIAAYERTLVSNNSRYDQFINGNSSVFSSDEKAGFDLFSKRLYCTECHKGPNLTDYAFKSNGIETTDEGRYLISGKESDKYCFKISSLRNITLTSPYMHDGSFHTLEEVVDFYAAGGGHGINKSKLVVGFNLTQKERKQLIAFFGTLIDIPE